MLIFFFFFFLVMQRISEVCVAMDKSRTVIYQAYILTSLAVALSRLKCLPLYLSWDRCHLRVIYD